MVLGPILYQHKSLLIEHTILLTVSVLRVDSNSYAGCVLYVSCYRPLTSH